MAEGLGRIDGWRNDSPQTDSPRDFQSFGPPTLGEQRGASKHWIGHVLLDNAFVLIERHPKILKPHRTRLADRTVSSRRRCCACAEEHIIQHLVLTRFDCHAISGFAVDGSQLFRAEYNSSNFSVDFALQKNRSLVRKSRK